MADYVGDYANDFNRVVGLTKLPVYLVTNTSLTTVLGTRENTSFEFDSQYLPSVFLNAVQPYTKGFPVCPINITPRFAKLYLTNDSYLRVELPFIPGSSSFNQFFIAVGANINILTIGIEGEAIKPYYLNFNANS
jgi:hypothetical protein